MCCNNKLIFLLLALLVAPALATHVAVLETVSGSDVVTLGEKQYLTDVLRSEAIKVLHAEQNYTIMTRENINAMLPPGKSIEECEGSCLVETGRNISADYVAQAHVGKFIDNLTITVELYETAGNKLLGSFSSKAPDVESLETEVRLKSPGLFSRILASSYGTVDLQPLLVDKIGHEAELVVKIDDGISKDGRKYARGQWSLTPGEHTIEFLHRCYEPLRFVVNVLSGKTTTVNNALDATMGQFSLTTMYKGAIRDVPVYVNGSMIGRTPLQGRIPICATVEVGEAGFQETVEMEWNNDDKLEIVYTLNNAKPTAEEMYEDSVLAAKQLAAENAILAAADKKRKNEKIRNVVSIVTTVLGLASVSMGIYENKVMKDERKKYDRLDGEDNIRLLYYTPEDRDALLEEANSRGGYSYIEEYALEKAEYYDKQWDKVESAKTKRNIFYGVGAGLIGAGAVIYFAF